MEGAGLPQAVLLLPGEVTDRTHRCVLCWEVQACPRLLGSRRLYRERWPLGLHRAWVFPGTPTHQPRVPRWVRWAPWHCRVGSCAVLHVQMSRLELDCRNSRPERCHGLFCVEACGLL